MTHAAFIAQVEPGQVLIMRGIPGAGKSRLVGELKRRSGLEVHVVSTDEERTDAAGAYRFDWGDTRAVRSRVLNKFLRLASDEDGSVLVVDNASLTAQAIAPYYAIAEAQGWEPVIVNVEARPVVAAKRNVHGVSLTDVLKSARAMRRAELPRTWKQVTVS